MANKDAVEVSLKAAVQGTRFNTIGQLIEPVAPFFWTLTAEIERRCRDERRERGEGGGYVWTIEEWQAWCEAAMDSTQGHLELYGYALTRSVKRIRELISVGFTAREIHTARYWDNQQDETREQQRAAYSREIEARAIARERQLAVDKEKEIQLIREEGRALAKREAAQRWGGPRSHGQPKLIHDSESVE